MTLAASDKFILDKLGSHQLPTLPPGAPYLLKQLSNENIDFGELVSIIGQFPSISGKLLSLANSVWSGSVSSITSLDAACARLGFSVIRSTSIALAVAAPFNPTRCPNFDPEYFWTMALLTADAASGLASVATTDNDLEPATARAAGLLHNLGLLWMVDKLPAEIDRSIKIAGQKGERPLRSVLIQELEFDHAQAGGCLGRNWGLPAPLVEAMSRYPDADYQGAHVEIVDTVGLAVELVSAIWNGEPCPEPGERFNSLGISVENLDDVFVQLDQKLQKIRDLANTLFG